MSNSVSQTSVPISNHPDPVRHILLVTLSNIGDALMTTPVMEALHGKHPQAMMDIVADPRSSELFAHCPYLHRVIHRDKSQGWRGSLALVRELRRSPTMT